MSAISFSPLPSTRDFDFETTRLMLHEFYAVAHNLRGGGLAMKMERLLCDEPAHRLDEETFATFSKWCHTSGRYRRAEPFAQAISLWIYGIIIPRVEE